MVIAGNDGSKMHLAPPSFITPTRVSTQFQSSTLPIDADVVPSQKLTRELSTMFHLDLTNFSEVFFMNVKNIDLNFRVNSDFLFPFDSIL